MRFCLILILSLCISSIAAFAQIDSTLKFNVKFTRAERKWVVLPRKSTEASYTFGFIYIDQQAGYTFDLKGGFSVDKNNKYIPDTSATKNNSIKYRIAANWTRVALISSAHFAELNVPAEPKWLKIYYDHIDTITFNYKAGWACNDAGDCETALKYLNKTYQLKPHFPGLEFEMAFAYNALNQPDSAIMVLTPAIKNNPKNIMFHRELGYAYLHQKDYDKAVATYKQGIAQCSDQQNEEKAEMAYNMASIYKTTKNADEYKNWITKAKLWTKPGTEIYKGIVAQGF